MRSIELKPAGLETKEGIARANRAIAAQETAIQNSANALRDLLDALRDEDRLSSSARAALADAVAVHEARRDADEEVLRAISNHPRRT